MLIEVTVKMMIVEIDLGETDLQIEIDLGETDLQIEIDILLGEIEIDVLGRGTPEEDPDPDLKTGLECIVDQRDNNADVHTPHLHLPTVAQILDPLVPAGGAQAETGQAGEDLGQGLPIHHPNKSNYFKTYMIQVYRHKILHYIIIIYYATFI